jgi:hypothetical protein
MLISIRVGEVFQGRLSMRVRKVFQGRLNNTDKEKHNPSKANSVERLSEAETACERLVILLNIHSPDWL